MARDVEEQPAVEARKAEGANRAALLIPIPPKVMGREACIQLELVRVTLQIDLESSLKVIKGCQ